MHLYTHLCSNIATHSLGGDLPSHRLCRLPGLLRMIPKRLRRFGGVGKSARKSSLEYLLRGLDFEVVKLIGRYKSEAFRLNPRCHAQSYLQAPPEIKARFARATLPSPPHPHLLLSTFLHGQRPILPSNFSLKPWLNGLRAPDTLLLPYVE